MRKEIIKLPEEVVTNLERLEFESEMLRDNICFLLDTRRYDSDFFSSPVFQEYTERQIQKAIEYSRAKNEITNTYVKEKGAYWSVDFNKKELEIQYEE